MLVEKDWVSIGHQFAYRNGNYVKEMSEDQRSSIFVQWLDCVHQLLFQFPHAFEFNMEFLVFIASIFNTCLYGTFLFNNDKEREENNAYLDTISIWTDVLLDKNINKYLSPFYKPHAIKELLNFNYGYHKIRVWEEFYLQFSLTNSIKLFDFNNLISESDKVLQLKNYMQFFEYSKKTDLEEIEKQKETIYQLKDVIKDLSCIVDKKNISNQLKESTKNQLQKLNLHQTRKSDKIEFNQDVDGGKLKMVEDYIPK